MIRRIAWDYENNIAVEYDRAGHCSMCGACCTTRIGLSISQQADNILIDRTVYGLTVEHEGLWAEIDDAGHRRFYGIHPIDRNELTECPKLATFAGEFWCIKHANHMHDICSDWPIIPQQIAEFGECTYTFIPIQEWRIDE